MKKEIVELYLSGLNYNQIKEKLGCSKATISYHCSGFSRKNIKVTEECIIKMKKLYESNINFTKIGEILNISRVTVAKYLKNTIKAPINKTLEEKRERIRKYRIKIKQQCVDYKGGCCQICGYSKCNASLDFHHLDPKEKDFGISKGGTNGFEKLKTELDKCILVCRNCHGEIHQGLHPEINPLPDTQ